MSTVRGSGLLVVIGLAHQLMVPAVAFPGAVLFPPGALVPEPPEVPLLPELPAVAGLLVAPLLLEHAPSRAATARPPTTTLVAFRPGILGVYRSFADAMYCFAFSSCTRCLLFDVLALLLRHSCYGAVKRRCGPARLQVPAPDEVGPCWPVPPPREAGSADQPHGR